ncbi:MAG: hypothetical protein H6565_10340 [Lewinellaceae bacterium]|nr:hypothetical protein [Saprospiraceae bacterium]MCB9306983.1 hypothetical protein [Lewinellaceae bacterium]
MSVKTTKSFAWLWIAALLTATIGISVKQIYCYCLDRTTISLFSDDSDCSAKGQEMPSCCEMSPPGPSTCCPAGAIDHNCEQKSTKVFQLKPEFVVDNPFEKSLDGPLWLDEIPVFKRMFKPVICGAIMPYLAEPPPFSGREICVRHQLFLC